MSFWLGVIVGVVGAVVVPLLWSAGLYAAAWLRWKRRELKHRREWTQENPYWREAYELGRKDVALRQVRGRHGRA